MKFDIRKVNWSISLRNSSKESIKTLKLMSSISSIWYWKIIFEYKFKYFKNTSSAGFLLLRLEPDQRLTQKQKGIPALIRQASRHLLSLCYWNFWSYSRTGKSKRNAISLYLFVRLSQIFVYFLICDKYTNLFRIYIPFCKKKFYFPFSAAKIYHKVDRLRPITIFFHFL